MRERRRRGSEGRRDVNILNTDAFLDKSSSYKHVKQAFPQIHTHTHTNININNSHGTHM